MTTSIFERYNEVQDKVQKACAIAGRDPGDVKIIVVTKGFEAKKVLELKNTGAEILGENYPEETIKKIETLKMIDPSFKPVWHMIGHLQSRKIKYMYPHFAMIHSIDSVSLAEKINETYKQLEKRIDVLIEINIAGELTKNGFQVNSPQKRRVFLENFMTICSLSNLSIKGLMCMPPFALKEEQNRKYYELCYFLQQSLKDDLKIKGLDHLSMGTSADYHTAILCGATMVRVGEAIMGKRIYQ